MYKATLHARKLNKNIYKTIFSSFCSVLQTSKRKKIPSVEFAATYSTKTLNVVVALLDKNRQNNEEHNLRSSESVAVITIPGSDPLSP